MKNPSVKVLESNQAGKFWRDVSTQSEVTAWYQVFTCLLNDFTLESRSQSTLTMCGKLKFIANSLSFWPEELEHSVWGNHSCCGG